MREWGVRIEGAEVLDVGCGDGGGISAMADAGMICKGFDRELPYIELARNMTGERELSRFASEISIPIRSRLPESGSIS